MKCFQWTNSNVNSLATTGTARPSAILSLKARQEWTTILSIILMLHTILLCLRHRDQSQEDRLAQLYSAGDPPQTSKIIPSKMLTTTNQETAQVNLLFLLRKMISVRTSIKPWITTTRDSEETWVKEINVFQKDNKIKAMSLLSKISKTYIFLRTMLNNPSKINKGQISLILTSAKVNDSGVNGVNLIITYLTVYSITQLLSNLVSIQTAFRMVLLRIWADKDQWTWRVLMILLSNSKGSIGSLI